ncbi:hypothetical protein NW768_000041 [Fusarium equiseti]|uniref:Cell wall proline rich protein n=1 Tax=Fusarium equiseti TaxID=61235 RepID=A0ABQ8RRT9_FUSEQ|nr:hypothetical protein NW768_000041 [Fusarium equiseti]
MATTVGPERLSRPSPGPAFDSPVDRFAASINPLNGSQPLDSKSQVDEPPPNPPFVFPAQPAGTVSAPSSFSRATGRRPMSAIETPNFSFGLSAENAERHSRSALPDFSFNPGAMLSPDRENNFLLTPPISPHSPRNGASQQRPGGHGHRRGGSEFVGGRLREGNSIAIMSTSPTKSESGLVSPTFQPPPRRGHRRGISGAISTNDLPILQPPVFDSANRGNSAPNSPTNFVPPNQGSLQLAEQIVPDPEPVPTVEASKETTEPAAAKSSPDSSPKNTKARVGFSDTLEFIPRPLSLVSNETSSTVTARPGHSLSGSISSIVSGNSPSGRDSPSPLSQTTTREISDSRPSTAGAVLENTHDLANAACSPKRRNSIPTLLNLAEAPKTEDPEPSPTRKRWSFFAREHSSGNTSPGKARPQSAGSLDLLTKITPSASSGHCADTEGPDTATAKPKSSKKGKKKKKKVKGWAGAILPRKPKSHNKRSKSEGGRPPTPPAPSVARYEGEDQMYGEPELLQMSTPTLTVTESPDLPQEDEASKRSTDESTYPMIDLDAALGPFNTPLPLNPEWEAAQRAASGTGKRRLHSAQGMKGFSGPGMHYHRRAESAPDLPPFDPGRAGMHRYNSSSTMADVFEEDEEDDDDNARSGTTDESSEEETDSDCDATPPAAVVRDPLRNSQDKLSVHNASQPMRRTTSSLSDKDQISANTVRGERSRSSLHESVIAEELPSVIFRSPFMPAERCDTADSARSSLRRFSGNKDLSPGEVSPLHLPAPAHAPTSPYAISYSSSFPSPRSPMSVDVQRISTAPSSVADENNFRSLLLMGEPGPEVRVSVDYDIPSLTSSNSTMTRESMFLPSQRQSQPTLREPRPVSVSSAFGRRRSSLASLSRLISSSHGERSKLSMEVTLDNDESKKPKSSRTKKLGRMMQFWKPTKDKETIKEKEGDAK